MEEGKKKRLIFGLIAGGAAIIDIIIFLVIFLPKLTSNNSSNKPYQMGENTSAIYENIIKYAEEIADDTNPEIKANSIVAIDYDSSYLNIALQNDNQPIYLFIDIGSNKVDDVLAEFVEKPPLITKYTYQVDYSYSFDTNHQLNIQEYNKQNIYKGYVAEGMTNTAVSFTTQYDESTIATCTKDIHNESGLYEKVTKVKLDDNRILYDLLYYIIH